MALLAHQDRQVLLVQQVQQVQLAQQDLAVPQEQQVPQARQDRQVLQVQPLPFHTHTVPPQDKQHLAVPILTH
jgi:hypothetical protein